MNNDQDTWSYGGPATAGFDKHSLFSPEGREKVQSSFMQDDLVRVFSDELKELFFVRGFPEHAPRARKRYALAVGSLCQFMKLAGFEPHVVGEMVELCLALHELDHGIVRHFLKPKASRSRPQDPGDLWDARAFVAIAVDCLMATGLNRRTACRVLGKEYDFLARNLSPTSKRDFALVIEGWHREFLKEGRSGSKAQHIFNNRTQISQHPHIIARGAVKEIMETAILTAARAATPEAIDAFKSRSRKRGI